MKGISSQHWPEPADRFSRDVPEHEMTVLHDDGLYRHIRFKKPGTMMYFFDLVTWPGSLVINGDMGTYTFSREPDMIREFFGGTGYINADYWAEKTPGGSDSVKEFSRERFRAYVWEHYRQHCDDQDLDFQKRKALWVELRWRVLDPHHYDGDLGSAYAALNSFAEAELTFDVCDIDGALTEYAWHYLWCCCAIAAGCRDYIATHPKEQAA